jgi:hypothetical protein
VADAGATVIPTEGTSRVAKADWVASVADVPVRVTVMLLAGGVAGAVYVVLVPLVGETAPQPGEHGVPLWVSSQLTLPVPASLFTVPEIIREPATCTVAEVGDTETVIAGTVIVAVTDFVESATAVALRVTVRSFAGGPGAV